MNCLEVSSALPHPALALPWDFPGLCDIPPLAQDGPGWTVHGTERAPGTKSHSQSHGGVWQWVTAQCQLNEVSLFHALLEYFSPRLFSSLKSNRYLNSWIYELRFLFLVFLAFLYAVHSQMASYCYFIFYFLISSGVFGIIFFSLSPALWSHLQGPNIASPFGHFPPLRCWWFKL